VGKGLAEPVIAYLDTHVAIWLHDGLIRRLSKEAKRYIEHADLFISPMVLLEFQYLHDRKRVQPRPMALYGILKSNFGVDLCEFPFAAVAMEAVAIGWTSDPFDRIIVAQARANHESVLLTADEHILKHYKRSVW
jgi:PIN domain nuclease of toxin-antitoxin system